MPVDGRVGVVVRDRHEQNATCLKGGRDRGMGMSKMAREQRARGGMILCFRSPRGGRGGYDQSQSGVLTTNYELTKLSHWALTTEQGRRVLSIRYLLYGIGRAMSEHIRLAAFSRLRLCKNFELARHSTTGSTKRLALQYSASPPDH